MTHLNDTAFPPALLLSVLPSVRVRRIVIPTLLKERVASRLCRSWRCAVVRKRARFERARLRLAQLANPLVRGFLSRVVARSIREERRKKKWDIISVRFLMVGVTVRRVSHYWCNVKSLEGWVLHGRRDDVVLGVGGSS